MDVQRSRYTWIVPKGVDLVANLLTQPFQHILSLTLSCYILTTFDTCTYIHLFLRWVDSKGILYELLPGYLVLFNLQGLVSAGEINPHSKHANVFLRELCF